MKNPGPLIGWILMIGAIAGTVVLGTLPAPYVLESPGPVYDTIGEIQQAGKDTPVISIEGEQTYDTSGTLDMLTVNLRGSRQTPLSWIDLATVWFDPSRAILPLDAVYPNGETEQQSNEQATADMRDSQQTAVAAALGELDIAFTTTIVVTGTIDGYPAAGVLKAGDEILTVDGTPVDSVDTLSRLLGAKPAGASYGLGIRRSGAESTVSVTTKADPDNGDRPIIGIAPGATYDFPFPVTVNLGDVGGPSAGTMLALGIYDKLTPGALTGGERFAGTGTISADGVVGPIGGIRQKMYGAQRAGATWFLAPEANCDEVVGHIPAGLHVFAMASLDDAIDIVQTIADGKDTSKLPTCGR